MGEADGAIENHDTPVTFAFQISNQERGKQLKSIPPNALPNFYGFVNEDLDTFLFVFDVLYRSYDYVTNAHHLELFPTTLKNSTLRWFMGLASYIVTT